MSYEIKIQEVQSGPISAVQERTSLDQLSKIILPLFDEVYGFLKESDVKQNGQNVIVYLDDAMNIEVGVQISADFNGSGRVVCSSIPGGRVATTVHMGPYSRLPEAHAVVREWCSKGGHELTGPRWEIYGDWDNDPSKLRTDVFYQLGAG